MSNYTYFYVLVDPFTLEPRYVGKTKEGISKRLYSHMLKEQPTPAGKWMHDLKRKGTQPIALELERKPLTYGVNVVETERFWVEYFSFLGADLTNCHYNGFRRKGKSGNVYIFNPMYGCRVTGTQRADIYEQYLSLPAPPPEKQEN